jgi:hypothetical protein
MRLIVVFTILLLTLSCKEQSKHYRTDEDFVLISDKESPNKKFIITEYQFDIGALGYSRVFWAIVPNNRDNVNLSNYLLPDGYKAAGWTDHNEAIIEKWEPYYYKSKIVELKSGDLFNGVKLIFK